MSDYADNLRRSMTNATRRFIEMVQEMQEKDDAALREQVIRMAKEAGFTPQRDEWLFTEMLERFFHLAAAAGAECATKTMPFLPAFQSEEIEEMSKDTGGPAFPVPDIDGGAVECGMTLRDYFAAKAMQGLCAGNSTNAKEIAGAAYIIADAMLKARECK